MSSDSSKLKSLLARAKGMDMRNKLFWVGTALAGISAVLSLLAIDVGFGGVPTMVQPTGAVAVGISAIALIYASRSVPE